MAVTVGAPRKVNLSLADVADVPPAVVTVTSTVPEPPGEVTVTDVAVLAVTAAEAVPNLTDVAEPRLVPVTTTLVPPVEGPEVGAIEVTVGAAT